MSDLWITSKSMIGHWQFFKLMILLSIGCSSAERCDRASAAQEREGNLGQSGDFNWLGVLHVHLNELIATSGIVLIKIKYALVNADDVARIPQHIFRLHSEAMFLAARDNPWFVKLTSYVTHPEYELSNLNTIAVIELALNGVVDFPLKPICFATAKTFNASRYLYLTGFTHENDILEKVIYKIQYLDAKVCEESYNRSEVSSQRVISSAHLCGYAPNSATQCVWDNGMTLVSNSYGYLNLVGFGVHGPGCVAPARFIDLFPYFNWINSITSTTPSRDDYKNQEFVPNTSNKRKNVVPNVPIHELYQVASRRQMSKLSTHEHEVYPYELYDTKFHLIEPARDKKTFFISAAKDSWGRNESACALNNKVQMYQEVFELRALDNLQGAVTYKLSMYDAHYSLVCVRLTVDCTKRSDFIIKFKEYINFKKDTDMDGTPEELFRYYPKQNTKETEDDKKFLAPSFVDDHDVLFRIGLSYDLYITFEFTERGKLKFTMFAPPRRRTTSTTTTPTTTTTTGKTTLETKATTKKPKAPTEKPKITTKKPKAPTKKPKITTKKPKAPTKKPKITTKKPIAPTKKPKITTKKPKAPTKKPKVARKAKTKVKAKQQSHWGVDNWADNMLREAEVSIADVEEVYGIESAAHGERMPVTTVIAGCLIGVGMRRALYIR